MIKFKSKYSRKQQVLMGRGLQLELCQIIGSLCHFAYDVAEENKYAIEAYQNAKAVLQSLIDFEKKKK